MRALSFLIFLFISVTAFGQSGYPVTNDEDYSVTFMAKPEHETRHGEWNGHEYEVQVYLAKENFDTGNVHYAFGYFDYPEAYAKETSVRKILDDLVSAEDGKSIIVLRPGITSEKDLTLNGYPGREYISDFSREGKAIYLNAFLAGNRLYFAQAIVEGSIDNSEAYKFLNSLWIK